MRSSRISLFFYLILFFCFGSTIKVISQQSENKILPFVGDTVDKNEKLKYSLFPEVSNDNFIQCIVNRINDNYELYFICKNDFFTKLIDSSAVQLIQDNLYLIDKFYSKDYTIDTIQNDSAAKFFILKQTEVGDTSLLKYLRLNEKIKELPEPPTYDIEQYNKNSKYGILEPYQQIRPIPPR